MDTRRCEVLSTASEPTPEVPTDPPHTHPPFRCAGEDGCKQVASSSSIYLGYMYMYLDILTKLLFIYFFPFGFMIPCLQPDSASEQKEKAAGCVSYPPGPFLGGSTSVLRAG